MDNISVHPHFRPPIFIYWASVSLDYKNKALYEYNMIYYNVFHAKTLNILMRVQFINNIINIASNAITFENNF